MNTWRSVSLIIIDEYIADQRLDLNVKMNLITIREKITKHEIQINDKQSFVNLLLTIRRNAQNYQEPLSQRHNDIVSSFAETKRSFARSPENKIIEAKKILKSICDIKPNQSPRKPVIEINLLTPPSTKQQKRTSSTLNVNNKSAQKNYPMIPLPPSPSRSINDTDMEQFELSSDVVRPLVLTSFIETATPEKTMIEPRKILFVESRKIADQNCRSCFVSPPRKRQKRTRSPEEMTIESAEKSSETSNSDETLNLSISPIATLSELRKQEGQKKIIVSTNNSEISTLSHQIETKNAIIADLKYQYNKLEEKFNSTKFVLDQIANIFNNS